LGRVKHTCGRFSWYASDDLRSKIEPPSRQQYKPGDFLAIRPLNWDDIVNEDNDDVNWADSGAPGGGRNHPGGGNENDDSEGEEEMQGSEKGTALGKRTIKRKQKGKGKGKWKSKATEEAKGNGKGNSTGKGNIEQTPGGDDISRAIALRLQKEMNEADSDTEG